MGDRYKGGNFLEQNQLNMQQMVQFECPCVILLSVSLTFGPNHRGGSRISLFYGTGCDATSETVRCQPTVAYLSNAGYSLFPQIRDIY